MNKLKPILVEDSSDEETIETISKMLPNREKVRFFIWDNLEPPISSKVDLFLRENIDSYGTWKEIYRANGNLAYRGWLYRQQKQGHWVYFYKDGRPHKDCYYRNNKFHAKCTFWKENGDYEIIEYYKGKCNGYKLRYRKDGLLYKELYSMKDESNL